MIRDGKPFSEGRINRKNEQRYDKRNELTDKIYNVCFNSPLDHREVISAMFSVLSRLFAPQLDEGEE